MNIKSVLRVDDTFDVFCVHGIGGIVGNILTGVFAQKSIAAVDGSEIKGGWLDGNWIQVPIQLLDTLAGMVWSFCVTALILFVINKIPGLHLRADREDEKEGLDFAELGITMYEHIEDIKSAVAPTLSTLTQFTGPDNGDKNNGEVKKERRLSNKNKEQQQETETTENL